jgi:hypothetical protein
VKVDTVSGEKHVWATFSADQVDVNFANPNVLLEFVKILLFYVVEAEAKYIRLDAVGYLWKEIGTPCIHLPETHAIIRLLREILQLVNPEVAPITETAVVQGLGFRVVVGDRFSHLIGGGAGKGKAVKELVARYQAQGTLTTVGLGNSPNDLEMLEAVDIPAIVPGKRGAHPGLAGRGWQVAPAPGALGWAQVVREICDRDRAMY